MTIARKRFGVAAEDVEIDAFFRAGIAVQPRAVGVLPERPIGVQRREIDAANPEIAIIKRALNVPAIRALCGVKNRLFAVMRLPIFSKPLDNRSMSWNFAPNASESFGFWCAGFIAQPTKK